MPDVIGADAFSETQMDSLKQGMYANVMDVPIDQLLRDTKTRKIRDYTKGAKAIIFVNVAFGLGSSKEFKQLVKLYE